MLMATAAAMPMRTMTMRVDDDGGDAEMLLLMLVFSFFLLDASVGGCC